MSAESGFGGVTNQLTPLAGRVARFDHIEPKSPKGPPKRVLAILLHFQFWQGFLLAHIIQIIMCMVSFFCKFHSWCRVSGAPQRTSGSALHLNCFCDKCMENGEISATCEKYVKFSIRSDTPYCTEHIIDPKLINGAIRCRRASQSDSKFSQNDRDFQSCQMIGFQSEKCNDSPFHWRARQVTRISGDSPIHGEIRVPWALLRALVLVALGGFFPSIGIACYRTLHSSFPGLALKLMLELFICTGSAEAYSEQCKAAAARVSRDNFDLRWGYMALLDKSDCWVTQPQTMTKGKWLSNITWSLFHLLCAPTRWARLGQIPPVVETHAHMTDTGSCNICHQNARNISQNTKDLKCWHCVLLVTMVCRARMRH